MSHSPAMALAERDPNASGRTSRASNLSAGSRGPQKGLPGGTRPDLLSSGGAGVMSMLRTSTELGDIGGLTNDYSTNMPRGPRRGGASSRLSTSSSHSNASRRTSNHQARLSASSGARRSFTRENNVPQYDADTLSPTMMNLPGSSPLIPRSRTSREGHRSLSMTTTSQPTFRLSSHRSFASLRTQEPVQRPKSPYRYPARLRRPGYRPTSPALSDITSSRPRQAQGLGLGQPGHMRRRTPSDMSVHRDERMSIYATRNRSQPILGGPYADVPPVPPLHHHRIVLEHTRNVHRSAKGSVSSGSTNRRMDSEPPSSDAPSPPTPKDGSSLEVLVSPTRSQMLLHGRGGTWKEDVTTGPLYYDYSEQFEQEQYTEPEATALGFVHRIKTILEERGTPEKSPKKVDVAELPGSDIVGVVELPASPVPRRITRELILAALEPASTTEDVGVSEDDSGRQTNGGQQQLDRMPDHSEGPVSYSRSKTSNDNRHSNLSQADSSVMDLSTLNFAVQYSIRMGTGACTGTGTDIGPTEDGMSDLLAGYQRTETKEEEEIAVEESDVPSEERGSHAPKSSDVQSFKSCAGLPARSEKDVDAKSFQSFTDTPEPLCKDSEGRSFRTCKDTITPDRAISMPPSQMAWPNQRVLESKFTRPFSEMPLASLPLIQRQPSTVCRSESGFSRAASRFRANSKLSSRHGSNVASISSSIDSPAHQPPSVPPRESSSSKEAQRSQAVADFLVRLSRPHRFSMHSSFRKKPPKDEGTVLPDVTPAVFPIPSQGQKDRDSSGSQATERHLTPLSGKQGAVPVNPTPASLSLQEPVKVLEMRTPPVVHQHSLSTPSPVVADPSSVYSPEDISSSNSVLQPSPDACSKSPERSGRDSHTTTHLVWQGRRSLNLPSVNTEPRFQHGNYRDETTTDLRLSAYRYPSNYLPDLKEESHEDSSLNTSASNLKHSSFRFPPNGLPSVPSVRESTDDALLSEGDPPPRLRRRSGLAHTRGLPSMNFSQMNLIEKLNEALDVRSSRTLDEILEETQQSVRAKQLRPTSAREIREKYRSFFASLDELEKAGDVTQTTSDINPVPLKRRYSPKALIEEIDRLTIPSVGGLTQRLSELLPSLREYYKLGEIGEFVAEEVIMEHALEEINEVGGPAPKRSSARLRPMPGSPNMVVIDDALYEELTGKEKDSPGSSAVSDVVGMEGVGRGRGESVTDVDSATPPRAPDPPLVELEAPSPTGLRTRSLSLNNQHLRPSLESRLSSRSLRSFVSTPTGDTRPWNSDKNYPWASTLRSIDISLPPTTVRQSPHPGPSLLRNRLSGSSASTTYSPERIPLSPASSYPVPGQEGAYKHAHRQSRRFSIFTSSKRANNPASPGFDTSGFATGPVNVRAHDQSHEAGERYPTSALTPPTNSNLIDSPIQISASDTSDDEPPATSKKSRFRLRSRFSSSARVTELAHVQLESSRTGEGLQSKSTTDLPQDGATQVPDISAKRQTFRDAEGMPSTLYHRHKVVDHLKKWWHKGGDLLRNLGKSFKTKSKSQKQADSQFPEDAESTAFIDVNGRRVVPLTGTRGVPLWTGV
ncbi:hypothetical protein BDV95DRAFT_111118 [Massariosphaeria phaeospora]|uniref:Uncharacterized protein n=1 Tax=Massariosphaeria phaeospora TaxID=100035 RepID=A0A7C8I7A6_9PLEO|nr:hypothetical protein BDV95DRAFT_111118 [Massariosphaeria phaeospora]